MMHKEERMIIYDFHVGHIRGTCNVVVGPAVTGGETEAERVFVQTGNRNDNIQIHLQNSIQESSIKTHIKRGKADVNSKTIYKAQ